MIPVMQTIFTNTNTLGGNCLPAAVASILELPLYVVPHFVQLDIDSNGKDDWYKLLMDWLKIRGLHIQQRVLGEPNVDEYYLVTGQSPRYSQLHHAVVYKNGLLVHDPHPDNTGVVAVSSLYTIRPTA